MTKKHTTSPAKRVLTYDEYQEKIKNLKSMEDIYGVDVSADMVSTITDKVLPLVQEWQSRPLSSLYAILYLDGIHFKVRDNGKVVNKCGYVILGINAEGNKEILGIWIGGSEGSRFWLNVLTEISTSFISFGTVCTTPVATDFCVMFLSIRLPF